MWEIGIIKVRYHYLIVLIYLMKICVTRMIEKQVHRKFGFLKTKQLVKAKVKQQLLMKMKNINWYNGKLLFSLFIEMMRLLFDKNRKRSSHEYR